MRMAEHYVGVKSELNFIVFFHIIAKRKFKFQLIPLVNMPSMTSGILMKLEVTCGVKYPLKTCADSQRGRRLAQQLFSTLQNINIGPR